MSYLSLRAVLVTVAVFLLASVPAFSDSQVRAVRLSFVEGSVQITHGSSQDFEKAMANLPMIQGTRLRTSGDGRAEVEFEDGSTIRLAPNSSIAFPELVLRESGGKASSIEISKGTAYVDFAGEKNEEFTLQFGKEKLALAHSARMRIAVSEEGASVAVFKGDIQIEGPSNTLALKKNQTGNFDFANWDPVPVGSYPSGASAWGVHDLVGNGWEWTSTVFAPFPGFRPMRSYPEYSAEFFDGEHYVMKGASPATARELVRRSFRNWFRPNYPYVYATFRTVK